MFELRYQLPILDSEFQNCHNKGNSVPLHMPWTHAQKNLLEQHILLFQTTVEPL